MTDITFILLRLPSERIRSHGLEFPELREEDTEVEIVAEVKPGSDEEDEVWSYERGGDVVKCFGNLFK